MLVLCIRTYKLEVFSWGLISLKNCFSQTKDILERATSCKNDVPRVEKSKRLLLANWMWSTSQEICHELSSCSIFNKSSIYDFAWSKKTHEGENGHLYAPMVPTIIIVGGHSH
jgi:hypothetical protein